MTDNELIAEFMGYRNSIEVPEVYLRDTEPYGGHISNFEYRTSWDWLMPVVEKIEELGFSFFIHNNGSYIRPTFYFGNFPAIGGVADNKITSTYNAVLKFIKWYNTQKV